MRRRRASGARPARAAMRACGAASRLRFRCGVAGPPVSRVLSPPAPLRERAAGGHPSGAPVARRFERPTRGRRGTRHGPPIRPCSGRGLPSRPVARPLVRSYRTISPLPALPKGPAVCFLWRFPSGCPAWELPSALSRGARTFLDAARRRAPRPPGGPARPVYARRRRAASSASLASASARRLRSRGTCVAWKRSSRSISACKRSNRGLSCRFFTR